VIGQSTTTGGVANIAERLAVMFPSLPHDTVQGAVSQLFRANANCSRQQLADMSLAALLEMSSTEPQAVTSFEPVCTAECVEEPEEVGRQVVEETEEASPTHDEALDGFLAELLGLADDELKTCITTLRSIFARIAEKPDEPKFRRLRKHNARFQAEVGRHSEALALMSHAGFSEETQQDGEVCLILKGKLDEQFTRVHEAVRAAADAMSPPAIKASPPSPSRQSGYPQARLGDERRQHIAALTEMRLKDPRGFRDDAARRRRANPGTGGAPPPGGFRQAAQAQTTSRRAQHFTLTDIENMRTQEAIAGMPSYADEYRLAHQASPATSYSTLVARSYDPELIARQALDGTNRYRASKGLMPLRWHDGIARIAREHAEQMARGQMPFSHDGVDQRFRAYPVAHRAAAENLALNSGVADVSGTAVNGWIKSPGHEKNLSGAFNLCGIGVARASNGTFYLTQLFALAM